MLDSKWHGHEGGGPQNNDTVASTQKSGSILVLTNMHLLEAV